MSVSGVGVLRLVSLFCPALLAINLLCFVTSLFHGIHGVPNRCRHMAYHELLVAFRTRPLAVLDYTSAYIALLSPCCLSLLPNCHSQPRRAPPSPSSVSLCASPFPVPSFYSPPPWRASSSAELLRLSNCARESRSHAIGST